MSFWIYENQSYAVNIVLVVIGAGLILGGLWVYRGRQVDAAHDAFSAALREYRAPIVAAMEETTDSPVGEPTFSTTEERYQTAIISFAEVASNYDGYEAGRQALYYKALCHAELDELEMAVEALKEVRSGNRTLVYYLATRTLGALQITRGDYESASELYRALLSDQDMPLSKDQILYDLASAEEKAGNLVDAWKYYQQIQKEYPNSPMKSDAERRSDLLEYLLDM